MDINQLIALCIVLILLTIPIYLFGIKNVLLGIFLGWCFGIITIEHQRSIIGGDDFPYKKFTMKPIELKQRFDRLKTFEFDIVPHKYYIKHIRPDLLQYNGKQVVISHPKDFYDKYDNLSDYFIESYRMNCIRSDQSQSVSDYWKSNKSDVIAHCKKKYGKISKYYLRESLFDLISECNTFKPSLLVGFIKMYKPKSILDISAGWGDRLIGALSQGINYIGVDPCEFHDKYAEMIKFFKHDTMPILIKSGFENVDLKPVIKDGVDMIFSSPPFYDLEKYSNDKSQSYIGRNVDEWYRDFLIFSIKKAWSFLNKNGHMVLYISDAYNRTPYVQRMIDEIATFGDSKYIGCLPQLDLKKDRYVRPFWIWQKV